MEEDMRAVRRRAVEFGAIRPVAAGRTSVTVPPERSYTSLRPVSVSSLVSLSYETKKTLAPSVEMPA